MNAVKPRNIYLDIIKGIAITLVVLGHSIQYGDAYGSDYIMNKEYYGDIIFSIIYSFHMPLFMLISGYLFYNSVTNHSFTRNLKTRFFQILSPIIIWNTLRIISSILIRKRHFFFIEQISSYFNVFWFLWAVFWCSILVLFIKRFFKDNVYIYIVIGLIAQFVPGENIGLYTYMYPYFVIGYLWNKYKFEDKISKINISKQIVLFIALLIFYSILLLNLKPEVFIYETGTYLLKGSLEFFLNQFFINTYRYIIGLIGSICLLLLIKYLIQIFKIGKSSIITKIFSALGQRTLGIYIISSFSYEFIFSIPNRENYGYGMIFLETIIILIVTYIIIRIIEYNNIIRQILLGWKV